MMTSHSSLSVSGARFGTGTSTKSMSSSAVNSSNSSLRQNSLNGPRNSSPLMLVSSTLSTESPRLFVGTADGKGGAAPVNANTQPGQLLREVWQIVRDGFARDGLAILGDAVAAVALFCMVGLGLFLGAGMGLQ